jgi:hypothetical protein
MAFMAEQSIVALAGQTTAIYVETVLRAAADMRIVLSITLAGGAAAWAVFERILRLRVIERLHGRIRFLEDQIDPHRSSSGLTTKGRTHPRDKGA